MIIAPGSTSVSIDVQFLDDTGAALTGKVAADFPACKWSNGDNTASTTITLTDLAAITTAHPNNNTAGGIKEREGGWYRADLPNNIFTSAGRKTLTFAETTNKRIIAPPLDCQYVSADAKYINAVSTSSVTTIKPVQGLAVDGVITTLTNLPAITAGWLTAAGIASDAITAAKIADGAIDTATFAGGTTIPRVTLTDTLTTYTGNTPQTGDNYPITSHATYGLSALYTDLTLRAPNRTWFVSISGNDSNAGTYAAPLLTYAAAEALAVAGDFIAFKDTYASKVTVTKSGLTLTSAGGRIQFTGSEILSDNLGAVYVVTGVQFTTLLNLRITGNYSEYGVGVRWGTVGNATLSAGNRAINCVIEGRYDGIEVSSQIAFEMRDCYVRSITSAYDGGNFSNCHGTIYNSAFFCDGSSVAASMDVTDGNRAIIFFGDNNLTFNHCRFIATRAIAAAYDLGAIGFSDTNTTNHTSTCTLNDCLIYAKATHASDTGRVYGIASDNTSDGRLAFNLTMNGGRIVTSTAGSTPDSGPWDIDAPTGSLITLNGSVTTDVTKHKKTGTAIINYDPKNIADTKTDTTNIYVDTHTTLPAAIDALPTNAELATALGTADDATLAAIAAIPAAPTAAQNAAALLATNNSGHTVAAQVAHLDMDVSDVSGGGGGTAAQVDNSDIVPSRVFKLSRRHDGVLTANGTLRMKCGSTNEKYPVWIDTSPFSGSHNLANVSDEESSDDAGVTIASVGLNREMVVLWLEAKVEGSYTVRATAHPRAADNLICELAVTVTEVT